MTDVPFPSALSFLFQPARYKVAWGGRGSGKSWGFASALLIQGAQEPLRILCCRELQRSIADSVHSLLADRIAAMGMEDFYEVQNTSIRGRNGTEFIFAGLRHNIASIKSIEGVDRCWVEEGQTISKGSLDVLIPTIRKDGSEIWVGFNPELAEDEVYRRFVQRQPPGAVVRKVNWSENPFFPITLRAEMDHLKATDPDAWLNVWEGHVRQTLEGAIFARELRQATEERRITAVSAADAPVLTFWDLGYSDMTSIWFAQRVGFEIRVVDFYQARLEGLDHYVAQLRTRPYRYERHYLPHDANQGQLSAAGKTVAAQLRARDMPVTVLPQLPVRAGLDALRTLFPRLWFDEERCADGLSALRRYRFDVDPQTRQFSKQPLHDDSSHAADALRQMAVALSELARPAVHKPLPMPTFVEGEAAWLA